MGQAKLMVGLVMISMFVIAILGYTINFGADNNAAVLLSDDADLAQLQTDLESTNQANYLSYNESEKSFRRSVVDSGDNNLLTAGTITDVGTTPRKSLNYVLNVAKVKLFGNDVRFGLILNMFMGLIIVLGLVYAWKTIKGGNPD